MPTKVVVTLAAVVALFLVVRDGGEETAAGQVKAPMQQGLQRVDAVLQEGLSEDTHEAISSGLSGSLAESMEVLRAAEVTIMEMPE